MLVSEREAIRLLGRAVSGREQAQLVLRSGLAGQAVATGVEGSGDGGRAVRLYDADRVRDLAARPFVVEHHLEAACPHGVYVARLPRSAGVGSAKLDLADSWQRIAAGVADTVAGQRPMSALTHALLQVRIRHSSGLPFVATLAAFVVLTADCTGFDDSREGGAPRPRLEPPGPWSRVVDRRRLAVGRGGRPWYVWVPPPPGTATSRPAR